MTNKFETRSLEKIPEDWKFYSEKFDKGVSVLQQVTSKAAFVNAMLEEIIPLCEEMITKKDTLFKAETEALLDEGYEGLEDEAATPVEVLAAGIDKFNKGEHMLEQIVDNTEFFKDLKSQIFNREDEALAESGMMDHLNEVVDIFGGYAVSLQKRLKLFVELQEINHQKRMLIKQMQEDSDIVP
ncbi:MAG: hypothetical protein JWM20_254 [Patescibacteria group bacterium]|nr:hypothetical protein [Patescibacteria group bacterium]